MMRLVREIATWAALLVLVAITAGAAVRVVTQGMPDTRVLEQSEIRQWLLARDVANLAPSERRKLARQLEIDFLRGRGWPIDFELLDHDRLERVQQNAALLMRAWLLEKVDVWESLPDNQREDYVNEQVDSILHWSVLLVDEKQGVETPPMQEALAQHGQRLARELWFKHFTPAEQQRIWPFLQAIVKAAPARALHKAQSRWPGSE